MAFTNIIILLKLPTPLPCSRWQIKKMSFLKNNRQPLHLIPYSPFSKFHSPQGGKTSPPSTLRPFLCRLSSQIRFLSLSVSIATRHICFFLSGNRSPLPKINVPRRRFPQKRRHDSTFTFQISPARIRGGTLYIFFEAREKGVSFRSNWQTKMKTCAREARGC